MKIGLYENYKNEWCYYNIAEANFQQKQYDYIFKYLDFDKLEKSWHIFFYNYKTERWFSRTYMKNIGNLLDIYEKSPLGYQWLKDNWGKGVFTLWIYYKNKQELKTIVNKVINIKLKRNE